MLVLGLGSCTQGVKNCHHFFVNCVRQIYIEQYLVYLEQLNGHAHSVTEGKFLVTKFEFVGSFGMSFKGDCHEVEVTPNLEFLVKDQPNSTLVTISLLYRWELFSRKFWSPPN